MHLNFNFCNNFTTFLFIPPSNSCLHKGHLSLFSKLLLIQFSQNEWDFFVELQLIGSFNISKHIGQIKLSMFLFPSTTLSGL